LAVLSKSNASNFTPRALAKIQSRAMEIKRPK